MLKSPIVILLYCSSKNALRHEVQDRDNLKK